MTHVTPHVSGVFGRGYGALCVLLLSPRSSTEELLSGPFNNSPCEQQPGSPPGDSSRTFVPISHKIVDSKGPGCPFRVLIHQVKIGCLYNGRRFFQTPL